MPRGLSDLVADSGDRVEGTQGVLEDDRDALSLSVAATMALGRPVELDTVDEHASRGDPCAVGQKAHDRPQGEALARPGLAHYG